MEVRCRRCNSVNVLLRGYDAFVESAEERINKKFFCTDCGFEFEVIE